MTYFAARYTLAGRSPACSAVAAQLASILRLSAVGVPAAAVYVSSVRPGWGGKLDGLEVEVEGADHKVLDALVAGPVKADVVGGPPGVEVLTAG